MNRNAVSMIKKMEKKKLIRILVLLLVILLATIYFFGKDDLTLTGMVEATIFPHTAEVSGKIIEMPIALGQEVKKGDVIAILDNTDQTYSLKQLELSLEKAKLSLKDTQIAGNSHASSNLSMASASYDTAQAAAHKALLDYEAALSLYNEGGLSKNELDKAKLASDSTTNATASAKAQLDNAKNQSYTNSAQVDIAKIESQIQQLKDTLQKYTITAICDGVVISKNYELGNVVSPGYNLAELSSQKEKYLVFYLPKEMLSKVAYDEKVAFEYGEKKYSGQVKFIDVKSEYTPKDYQTEANKNKDSVRIKILLPPNTSLKPGEKANILPIK